MNFIQVMGHLGADAETRFTPNGQKVTNLRIACNIKRGGKEETVWYKITLWGDRFDKMLTYLKKGSSIIVVGELGKPEIYTDREGKQQVSLEITAEFIRFSPFGKGERAQGNAPGQTQQNLQGQYTQSSSSGMAASTASFNAPDLDDGLPF